MTSGGRKRPPLREELSLFEATVAAEGITTGAGAAAGTSIIDAGLAGVGANSFVSMLMVVYPGQSRLVDSMDITAFNNVTGEVTLSRAYKGVAAAIPAGIRYKIVTFRFVPAEVAALTVLVNAILVDTDLRVMGRTQVIEVPITSVANAGNVVVATVTDQPCVIEAIIIHADAAQTGNMTTCAIYGGVGNVVTFIGIAEATQANLNAADKQVGWVGAVRLAATKTIVIDLLGTGAAPVDLTIVIKYRASVSGGHLA